MIDLSELTAKNLSLEELAQRLRDHDEPAVRVFAERVIESIENLED
jgi:hypothetical protein